MTDLNKIHKTLPAVHRYGLSVLIFASALILRFAIAPVETGNAYLTFYPSILISFYLCGTKPGIVNSALCAFAGYYIFTAPFWSLDLSVHADLATLVFFFSAWLAGVVVAKLHNAEDQLNQLLAERTEQLNHSNEELKHSNELLVMAERSAGAGAWYWDIRRDKVFWDTQLIALFGLDPSLTAPSFEVWGKVLHPDDYQSAHQAIEHSLENKKPFVTSYRIVMPDKSIRWIDAYGAATYDALGQPLEMRGICINSTLLREAERLKRQSE